MEPWWAKGSLLVKIVGPRLDWEGAGVGLGKGFEPGEDILESSEGGREACSQAKERNPPGKACFKAGPPAGRPYTVGPALLV